MIKHWTTKEGKEIEISKMGDSHLHNAFKHLLLKIRKMSDEIKIGSWDGDNGDACFDFVDNQKKRECERMLISLQYEITLRNLYK